jgi:archaellum component FlaF (FlaF/FlaG flagellin family)
MKKNTVFAMLLLTATCLQAAAQEIAIESKVIDCGQVQYRHPVTAEFAMRNQGNAPLVIKEVRTSCGCTQVDYPQQPIAPGQTFLVKTTYDAKTMGHFDKKIGVYSNGSKEPMVLSIHGLVVEDVTDFPGEYPYTLGTLLTDRDNIEFDNVNRGDRPTVQIHIKNNTDQVAEPVLMHLPNYLRAQVSPTKLAPGHSGTATIMLDSERLRDLGMTQTSIYLGMFPGDKVAANKEITVTAIALPDFEHLTDAQRANAPKMRLSEASLELGSFNGSAKKKGEITITNEGKTNLVIRSLQMLTAGLEVSLNKSTIAPGETAKLKITALAQGLKTARSLPRVLMITNDPENTKVMINVNIKTP